MPASARTYSLKDVDFIFGAIVAEGVEDGDFITIEYDEDLFGYSPNGDGGGTRTQITNEAAAITLTLKQSSPTNDLLSAVAELDRVSGGGVAPLLVKDNNGTSLHAAETAWLESRPSATYGKELGTREWRFKTGSLKSNFGSNNELG